MLCQNLRIGRRKGKSNQLIQLNLYQPKESDIAENISSNRKKRFKLTYGRIPSLLFIFNCRMPDSGKVRAIFQIFCLNFSKKLVSLIKKKYLWLGILPGKYGKGLENGESHWPLCKDIVPTLHITGSCLKFKYTIEVIANTSCSFKNETGITV